MNLGWILLLGLLTPNLEILGSWRYIAFIHEGRRVELPNRDLYLQFTFRSNGRARLYWSRASEGGFCEREAKYWIKGDFLHQETVWLNPMNRRDCQQDPDMQLGRKTADRFQLIRDELHLVFKLDRNDFIYILGRE